MYSTLHTKNENLKEKSKLHIITAPPVINDPVGIEPTSLFYQCSTNELWITFVGRSPNA